MTDNENLEGHWVSQVKPHIDNCIQDMCFYSGIRSTFPAILDETNVSPEVVEC